MVWPFKNKAETRYWLRVFAIYAIVEACIQLMFMVVLNNFGSRRISIVELHLIMWVFQCLLIWPIWWVAKAVYRKPILLQVIVNAGFYLIYSYLWFGPVQDLIGYLYENLQSLTRAPGDKQVPILDSGSEYSYLNYQLLKHSFRLSIFFLAAYFYYYQLEEKKRTALAIANKELQLKMLKWHLNPSFYFKTISHLQQVANQAPAKATEPILQLAKVMEYVIYEAKEKQIDAKKEISFLHNYTQMLNQQEGNVSIETVVEGDYEKLKIPPLLLAGLLDRLSSANGSVAHRIQLSLQFSGRELTISIRNGDPASRVDKLVEEILPGKLKVSQAGDQLKLSIVLDEE